MHCVIPRFYFALIVAIVAAVGTLSYFELGFANRADVIVKPPQISLDYGNQRYSGLQGSYCWSDIYGHGTCADYAAPSTRKDRSSPVNISLGSSLCFETTGYSNPSSFHVSITAAQNSSYFVMDKEVSRCLTMTMRPGPYFLTVSGTWNGKDTSNVFELHMTLPTVFGYACPVPYDRIDSPSDNSTGVQSFPIIAVPKGHFAVLCVTYYDNNKNKTQTIDFNGTVQVGRITASPYAGCNPSPCTTYPFVNSPDFEILSNVTSVEMGGNGTSKITVAYLITPTGESPGYYWLNIPYLTPTRCSIEFPFAYGYSFTEANSSGKYFPLPSGYGGSCISYLPVYYTEHPFAHLVEVSTDVEVVSPNCGAYTCDVKQT